MLDDAIRAYLQSGGKITQLPYGNAVRDNDGETWKQTNQRRYKTKLEKETGNACGENSCTVRNG